MRCCFFFALFISLVFSLSFGAHAAVFNAQTVTLENGLQIIALPNSKAPVVHHMIWYRVGAADEERNKSGLAHFFEHLMFRGTKTVPDGQFSKTISALGGKNNAFTAQDFTAYHQTIAKKHLETVMKMEADRMRGLSLSDEVIATEKQVILEERRERLESNPFARYDEKARAVLFHGHPYGTPIIGWEHNIENLNHQDIRDFYDMWYRPHNAVVVVSGDITLQELLELAAKTYGTIPKMEEKGRPLRSAIPKNITPRLTQKLYFSDPNIRQPYYRFSYLVPSEGMNERTATILQIITEILSGDQASLLYKKMVKEAGLAVSAGAAYYPNTKDWSSITFYATLKRQEDLEPTKKQIFEVVQDLVKSGVSEEILRRMKNRFAHMAVYARDSLEAPAQIVGESIMIGLSVEEIESWPDRLETITVEEVNEVLNQWFDLNDPEKFITPPIEGFLTPLNNKQKAEE